MSQALRDIAVVKGEVARLAMTEARWSAPSYAAEDRVAFRAEWRDLMDVLGELVDAYVHGRLTEDEKRAVREMAPGLIKAVPTMERLGLTLPPHALVEGIGIGAARM